jgi:hypothetical protein
MIKQRQNGGRTEVFDIIRKKWIPFTEEEKVRQYLIHFLVLQKNIPESHLSVERQIAVNGLTRRYDLVVFDRAGAPWLVIECKAPQVELTQTVVEQVGRYNKTLRAPYIAVSNGRQYFFFQIDFETEKITYLEDMPEYNR